MCKNLTLSASIISGDFLKIGEQLDELMQTDCNEIHYDVMDGHFVSNLSAGPVILDSIKEKIKCYRSSKKKSRGWGVFILFSKIIKKNA